MSALFLYCRPGFEAECAAEIQDHAGRNNIFGFCKAKPQSGYTLFQPQNTQDAILLHQKIHIDDLIFARQWFIVIELHQNLPLEDRIGPLITSLKNLPSPANEVLVETPDTNEGKTLSGLCRSLLPPLKTALRESDYLKESSDAPRLRIHICFLTGATAYIGFEEAARSAPWPMGIPRLKAPASAPSRSTLKLEEAFLRFLNKEEQTKLLRPGMRAVDLGASPGGWTWQLVRRHIHVVAVDNGDMDKQLLDSGLVEHQREDGFRYQPKRIFDWMVCDIVEQPIRIAKLAATWMSAGWCHRTIFNLKLPMKKRYLEVQRCLSLIDSLLSDAGMRYKIRCKQLYHDREEITVYLERLR